MTTPHSPRPNFDRIARPYRWLEYLSLGPILERLRMHHLPHLTQNGKTPTRALILGDGDGRFTARLLASYPLLQADAVDLSPAMLARLEHRCLLLSAPDAPNRLSLHLADAREYVSTRLPAASYDLVVTHFFLDCLPQPELEQLIRDVAPALTPNALWLLSEFRIPGGVLHWPARLYIRALYFAFRLLTGLRTTHLPDHISALRNAGFRNQATHRALFGLLTTELWQLQATPQKPTKPSTQ